MRSVFAFSSLLICLLGTPAMCADDAAALLKVIQSPATSDVDRANAFEKIGDLAGDDAVEPLASYLGDKKWSHYARFALQKMPGQTVTAALVKSLGFAAGRLEGRRDRDDRSSTRSDGRRTAGEAAGRCGGKRRRLGRDRPGNDRNARVRRGTQRSVSRRERLGAQSVARLRLAAGRTTIGEDRARR